MSIGLILAGLFWLGINTSGFCSSLIQFRGTKAEYQLFEQQKNTLVDLAAQHNIAELRGQLEDIFKKESSFSLNVRIAMADYLPVIADTLTASEACGLLLDIYRWSMLYKDEIDLVYEQENADLATQERLNALFTLREKLLASYSQVEARTGEGQVGRAAKVINTLTRLDLTNLDTMLWALEELPNVVSYAGYLQGERNQIDAALTNIARDFAEDTLVMAALKQTQQELSLRWQAYAAGQTDDALIDYQMLNDTQPNQFIKYHAYERLFKSSTPLDSTWEQKKLAFLKSGSKEKDLFENEVLEAALELPQARITNISPLGAHQPLDVISFQGETILLANSAKTEMIWNLFKEGYSLVMTQKGANVSFSFPEKGLYKVSFEVRQTVNKETWRSLSDATDVYVEEAGPPTSPTNLAARAISPVEVKLTWQDNSNSETDFKIERSLKPDSGFSVIDDVGVNVILYRNRGLAPNTKYFYRVYASSAEGDSFCTPLAQVTTPGPVAAPTNLTAKAISKTQVDIKWKDNSNNENQFIIQRRNLTKKTAFETIATAKKNVVSFSDKTVVSNTQYRYRVYSAMNGEMLAQSCSKTADAKTPK